MPGISDQRALFHSIIDSVLIPGSTDARLRSRGLFDTKAALRLRRVEVALLKRWESQRFDDLATEVKYALVSHKSGNHYYYKFASFVINLCKDKQFVMKCRSKRVVKQYQIANKLLEIKVPQKEYHHAITSLPEGYQRVHNLYLALRTLYDQLYIMHSNCGRNRGRLQSLNTKHKDEEVFQEKLEEWIESEEKLLEKERKTSSYSDSYSIGKRKLLEMIRISDLIYLKVWDRGGSTRLLLTANHFERCANLLKQISNILLGTLLAYGQEGNYNAESITTDILEHLKALYKIGIKDDLAVGEAGKAVTDLYKAKLSQTEELPWNNFQMLMSTYSDKRKENASELWADFRTLKHDPDILLNMSYVWKTAAQPDSSIRTDFNDLTDGLAKPNPISENAPEMIEVAIRRAVLVGALKENRQVGIKADPGVTISRELHEATTHSYPSDKQLRLVTHGMLRGIKVSVNNVFPNPFDVSHLMFKDKSSAKSETSIRRKIQERAEAEKEIQELEDESILANSHLAAEHFLSAIRVNPTRRNVTWALKSTANDILTSLDEKMSEVFKEAEKKFRWITKSLSSIRDKYGGSDFIHLLREWAKDNPDLLINTATEPKYGEVHKRSVRIFYMFEKGMKTFLSQFERIARIVGYYVKGAEIVKGDRAREQHMNVLSSAHKASKEGILAYQILFDLSKFSQKFNHKIIDAATKVIGELSGYPEYSQISDLFKASFLFVSSRNTDESYVGVLGAFEGFLNFLWTNIHATVMDIALRNCGRSGDLAAYSDDGLLMFTMNAKPNDPHEVIQKELVTIIDSIKATYSDFGLDFNLGKTLISRNLAEFLGVVQYKGHRFPTWMKELCHLGIPDDVPIIRSVGQEITDISSQMTALLKAGMPPFAAALLGYSEIFMGPGRRLMEAASYARGSMPPTLSSYIELKSIMLMCCLNQAFGGIRIPDPFTSLMTADFDPTSEMLFDIKSFLRAFPDSTGCIDFIYDKVKPTTDYTPLLLGAAPVNTEDVKYSTGRVRSKIAQEIKRKISLPSDHPLSRKSAQKLHLVLESMENIYLPSITSLTRYIVPAIMYEKTVAPTKSSSIARLLKKHKIRGIQRFDTKTLREQFSELMLYLVNPSSKPLPTSDELYRVSFPRLSFSPSLPSSREISTFSSECKDISYEITVNKRSRLDNKGSQRFLNQDYYDDLVPPLVTTDVTIQHIMNAPDLSTHCMRGVYSELISSSAQGHDLSLVVQAISEMNKCPLLFAQILTPLHDLRKIAVANRKKYIHRVYWSEAVKNAIKITRMGPLNHYMTSTSDLHYSLIVTSVLSRVQFLLTGSKYSKRRKTFYYEISPSAIESSRLLPMRVKPNSISFSEPSRHDMAVPLAVTKAIESEVVRTVDSTRQELIDNLLIGRMGMLADFQQIGASESILEPLRYAMVWSIISKIDSVVEGSLGSTGVTNTAIRSAPLENTPIDLVNLAIIFRAYRNIRKSKVGDAIKTFLTFSEDELIWSPSGIMEESVANETLAAVEQIGLVTSLDKESLSSAKSAMIYNSMLIANNISMIYYSLDTKAETEGGEKVSPARVRAMRRVVEAVTSRFFNDNHSNDTLERDLIKIVLMIIEGAMRGSVHRDEAFNARIAIDWLTAIKCVIINFHNTLPRHYKENIYTWNREYPRCRGLDDVLMDKLEKELTHGIKKYLMYDKGVSDQYDKLIKFILNLGRWGYLPTVASSRVDLVNLMEKVNQTMVQPAIMMARTVSYSTINRVMDSLPQSAEDNFDLQTSIEHAIGQLTIGCEDVQSYLDYLQQIPNDMYRIENGPLADVSINIFFPPDVNMTFGPALAYSLSLPLLFASGRTAFKSINVLGHSNPLYLTEYFSKSFAEVSLPLNSTGIPLVILQGLSEYEVWFNLNSWKETNRGEVIAAIEIPPAATTFSLGLISYLTSQPYSYATVALSSDSKGISIYVISILDGPLPRVNQVSMNSNLEVWSLGDGAVSKYIKQIHDGNPDILSALYLTPMHQAGLPVYSHYKKDGQFVSLAVEEELLDRHKVSFIETTKQSKSSQLYAKLPYKVSASIIRCHMMKNAENDAVINVLASFTHYIQAKYPTIPMPSICKFLTELFNMGETESDQSYIIKHMASYVVSLKEINPSSFPSMAQLGERDIEDPDFGEIADFPGTEIYAKTLMRMTGVEILEENERGILMGYIGSHQEELKAWEAWQAIKQEKPEEVRNPPRKRTVSKSQRSIEDTQSSSEIALRNANTFKPHINFMDRADFIETRDLFKHAFGESVFEENPKIPHTVDGMREFLKNKLVERNWDNWHVALIDDLTDEEVCQWSEFDIVDLETALLEKADEKRGHVSEDWGVV